jgi:hypothetical protein
MEVELVEDHGVSQLNLIAPDGTTYRGTDVATGATAVNIPILDIEPRVGGYEHYQPGSHQLVAVTNEDSKSQSIELNPELHISKVSQYENGERSTDAGNLAITVMNQGTAPTWIYDITYREAPNPTANDDLGEDPGVPQLVTPEEPSEMIVEPASEQTFVGTSSPFLFTDEERQCNGEYSLTVIAGKPINGPLEQQVDATVDGEVQSAGLTGEYTCTEIELSGSDGDTSDGRYRW